MRLSAPKKTTWWIAFIFGVLGIVAHFGIIPALGAFSFWLVSIGFVLLVLATAIKGL